MAESRTLIIALVTLVIGFVGGFVLRPVLLPSGEVAVLSPVAAVSTPAEARSTLYFTAHVDDARRVVAGCRNGSVRGGECANAEEAIIKVESVERRKRFLGN